MTASGVKVLAAVLLISLLIYIYQVHSPSSRPLELYVLAFRTYLGFTEAERYGIYNLIPSAQAPLTKHINICEEKYEYSQWGQ